MIMMLLLWTIDLIQSINNNIFRKFDYIYWSLTYTLEKQCARCINIPLKKVPKAYPYLSHIWQILLSIDLSLENSGSINGMNYVQEILILKLLEEFSFDAYYLIIFSSRNWRATKLLPVYIDINLPCLSGRKRKFREIHIKSKMLNPGHA